MSTSMHASAREDLGLPHVNANVANHPPPPSSSSSSYLSISASNEPNHHNLPKPLSLSPRTFGMDDFCSPLFKTGLTPRMFGSTGLTPRSGLTPRFFSGFTPRPFPSSAPGSTTNSGNTTSSAAPSSHTDTSSFFKSEPSKIHSTGYAPKDVKAPMRFPGDYSNSPPKMNPEPMHSMHKPHGGPQPTPLNHPMQSHPSHMVHGHPGHHPQHMHGHDMGPVGVGMFDYMNRPGVPTPPQTAAAQTRPNVSPMSEKTANMTQEELDERRRMKNRERVRKCRKRKQDRLNYLEDRTAELEKENGQLRVKLARKSSSNSAEAMSEEQLKDLRKKQNTTIAAYIRAYNEGDGDFSTAARNVWAENVEINHGAHGAKLKGLEAVVANKDDASAVFGLFKIKQYNVEWKQSAPGRCVVQWEVEASVKTNAPTDIPCTAPFAQLGAFLNESDVLTFSMVSHITFEDGKIAEETRLVNLTRVAEDMIARHSADPKKVTEILRCLLCG